MDDRHIFRLAYRAVAEALMAGRHVIFDATSLTITRRRKLLHLAQRHGARVSARFFPIPLATAFHRNRLRARQVPSGVIARMACLLMPPQYDEGFTRIVVDHQT